MTSLPTERTGVLVIRVWIEPDGLRARISRTVDVGRRRQTISTAATIDGACDAVRQWLQQFVQGDPPEQS